ncbi:hypothetical protein GLOTRDRAFT_112427 [Gloeophyllum trabeum ATCC 11539]|uniref:CUE domain-containing protein n=1 Tax=Gloeophyllum trabeum (strain ATCC 11539 / FP-39264 / Madison 617) TaxID=670483 RepID=S7PWB3_GLOTA|nr:uncharacterized protein GLOTRDRAFT_112427 [Gloeophyllum trabeum ATCC 11539]EPQ51612.1 hypothetical protein GLOTRDRAFT_112427 [Gloeophyllum trabeum ATCC 11539]
MAEVVNVLVAFAVIVILFRWVTSSKESPNERSAASTLGFRPRNITEQMVDTVQGMFPDIPRDNIKYDLLRTGSVDQTANKILERGFLDAPPAAYYTLYPSTEQAPPARPAPAPAGSSTATTKPKSDNLIKRFHLEEKVQQPVQISEAEVAGKAVWEDTPEKREASLQERKAKMILAARQRLLAQQQQAAPRSAGGS